MDNDAVDWMSWFAIDHFLADLPQNDVQGDMFGLNIASPKSSTPGYEAFGYNHSMASVDWETNTLETLGHQPQGLVTFARQSVIGEANFSSQDNEPIKSGSLTTPSSRASATNMAQ